jgi:cytochrome c-type biogenesis protein CcmH
VKAAGFVKPVAALLLLVLLAAPALANPEDTANYVSQNVMSPYCEGVTLHDCPSREAQDLRAQITTWAEQGMTRGEIIDRLVAEFGPQVRAVPSSEGAGILAWVLPALVLLIGALVAVVLARRFSARAPADPVSADAITPEQRARLDAELEALGGTP